MFTNKSSKNVFEDSYNAKVRFEFFSFNLKLNEIINYKLGYLGSRII